MSQTILILTNNIGGLHSFRKEVVKAIVDSGYDVYISEPDDDDRVRYFEAIGCKIIKTAFDRRGMNPLADIALLINYFRYIRTTHPGAVLSYTIKPNIYGGIACRFTKTPQLANVTGLGDAIENGGWLQRLTLSLYRFALAKAQRVFFQNSSNRDFFIRLRIAGRGSILLPGSGVNLNHHGFQPYPKDDSTVRFLFIGRLQKDKGIGEYLEAARIIFESKYAAEFLVLGPCEKDYGGKIKEYEQLGIVRYLGTTSDIRPYLSEVHCTVLPSYHEGMSNVNLESAANGRPVITTNVPGCRETVDDGQSGYLVEQKNSAALVDAITRFIKLPIEEKAAMGEWGRNKVEREFDRRIIVEAYLKEISRLSE